MAYAHLCRCRQLEAIAHLEAHAPDLAKTLDVGAARAQVLALPRCADCPEGHAHDVGREAHRAASALH